MSQKKKENEVGANIELSTRAEIVKLKVRYWGVKVAPSLWWHLFLILKQ